MKGLGLHNAELKQLGNIGPVVDIYGARGQRAPKLPSSLQILGKTSRRKTDHIFYK